MDPKRILQVRGDQIQLSEQCQTRPMHAAATDQPWANACQQLLGLVE